MILICITYRGDLRANVVEHFVPLPCHIALGQDESFTPNGREF